MADTIQDVVVIGAGLSGIAFSRFYLDIHPESSLTVLEDDVCVGGVWGASRNYNGFWSQSGLRMSGFSDQAVQVPPGTKLVHDIYESKHMTKYLEQYVDNHVYKGKSLRERILFGFKVISIEKSGAIWHIHGSDDRRIATRAIAVATGHTSRPAMPPLPGKERYLGSIIHQKEYGRASSEIFSNPSVQYITVLGGGKSAADMVYASVKAEKKVTWIIRQDGEGPAAFASAAGKGPYRNGPEIASTRAIATLSPSCFSKPGWLGSLIHGSALGRRIVAQIWLGADDACRKIADFENRQGALPGFEKLKSDAAIFWCTGPVGMVQRDDFWDTIAKNVVVQRESIVEMRERSILLGNGAEISSDVVFCGTGWNTQYAFLTQEQRVQLGLPYAKEDDPPEVARKWDALLQAADDDILSRFPLLTNPPPYYKRPQATTATRLYNCIGPLTDDSIVFLGAAYLPNAFRAAEAQAIWATARLDGNFKLPSQDQAEREVAYMAAFSRRRYPSHGVAGNYFNMDLVGYTDKLVQDLGLVSHRKRWWWQDFFLPCIASDYSGIKDEYLAKFKIHH